MLGPRRPYIFGLLLYGVGSGAGLLVDSFLTLLLNGLGISSSVGPYLSANGLAGGVSAAG